MTRAVNSEEKESGVEVQLMRVVSCLMQILGSIGNIAWKIKKAWDRTDKARELYRNSV